jgi:hypothetical protein
LLGDDNWSFDADRRAVELLLDAELTAGDLSRENREFINRAERRMRGGPALGRR